MNWCRDYRHIIDPNLPHSPEEIRLLTYRANKRIPLILQAAWFLAYFVPLILFFTTAIWLGGRLGNPIWLWVVAGMLALACTSAILGMGARSPGYVHRVRMSFRLDGYEVCTKCGYWLRDLPEDADRCPECGAKREPMPEDVK